MHKPKLIEGKRGEPVEVDEGIVPLVVAFNMIPLCETYESCENTNAWPGGAWVCFTHPDNAAFAQRLSTWLARYVQREQDLDEPAFDFTLSALWETGSSHPSEPILSFNCEPACVEQVVAAIREFARG